MGGKGLTMLQSKKLSLTLARLLASIYGKTHTKYSEYKMIFYNTGNINRCWKKQIVLRVINNAFDRLVKKAGVDFYRQKSRWVQPSNWQKTVYKENKTHALVEKLLKKV